MNVAISILAIVLLIIFGPKALNDTGLTFKPKISTPIGEITKDELIISPSRKRISFSKTGENWNEEFYISLVNNSDKTYYDINIAYDFPKYVMVSLSTEEPSALLRIGPTTNNTTISSDFTLLYGEGDDGSMGGAQKVINNIGPGERKKMKVEIIKKESGQDFDLVFKIFSYSKEPKPILSR